jgi:hypothetical protein
MGFGTDPQLLVDIQKYRRMFPYNTLVETGTYHGTSSAILSNFFDKVYTCEISDEYDEIREEKFKGIENIEFMKGRSSECLPTFFDKIGNSEFFLFLDAHWQNSWPLRSELDCVIDAGYKPFIFIHDFDCGHEGWQFDSYGDIVLNHDYIKDKMDLIYGVDGYVFEVSQESQNDPSGDVENKRGCGFYYPKI